MTTIEVLPLGAKVLIGDAEPISGVVLAVLLEVAGVLYRIGWWDGRNWRSDYLPALSIRSADAGALQTIGFHD